MIYVIIKFITVKKNHLNHHESKNLKEISQCSKFFFFNLEKAIVR